MPYHKIRKTGLYNKQQSNMWQPGSKLYTEKFKDSIQGNALFFSTHRLDSMGKETCNEPGSRPIEICQKDNLHESCEQEIKRRLVSFCIILLFDIATFTA